MVNLPSWSDHTFCPLIFLKANNFCLRGFLEQVLNIHSSRYDITFKSGSKSLLRSWLLHPVPFQNRLCQRNFMHFIRPIVNSGPALVPIPKGKKRIIRNAKCSMDLNGFA